MPRVYICGPIRNMPDGNKATFALAAQAWRDTGWEVISPWEVEDQWGEADHSLHRMHCLRDIAALSMCDVIALLPGYEQSTGCAAEIACANWMKLKIYNAETPIVILKRR